MTITTMSFKLPTATMDLNLRALGTEVYDRVTGIAASTFSLSAPPNVSTLRVFKNGTLMDDQAGTPEYTVSGTTVTLNVAAIAGDVFQIFYLPRPQR